MASRRAMAKGAGATVPSLGVAGVLAVNHGLRLL